MAQVQSQDKSRLNVLLAENRPSSIGSWSKQLFALLEMQGIVTYQVQTGHEAIMLAQKLDIHAAVVDLATPLNEQTPNAPANVGHRWLLELMGRLHNQPPVVLINSAAYAPNQMNRILSEALKLGAFSVINRPVDLEQLLGVFKRLMDRRYSGAWPTEERNNPSSNPKGSDSLDSTSNQRLV